MLGDIRMLEELAIAGDVYLFDMSGMTFGHLTRLALPVLGRMLTCAQVFWILKYFISLLFCIFYKIINFEIMLYNSLLYFNLDIRGLSFK
jgi:hypothetical protein